MYRCIRNVWCTLFSSVRSSYDVQGGRWESNSSSSWYFFRVKVALSVFREKNFVVMMVAVCWNNVMCDCIAAVVCVLL